MKNFKIMMLLAGFSSIVMANDKPYDSTERQADKDMFDDVIQSVENSPTAQRVAQSAANHARKVDHRDSDKAVLQAVCDYIEKKPLVQTIQATTNYKRAQAAATIVSEHVQLGAGVLQSKINDVTKELDAKVAQTNQVQSQEPVTSCVDLKTGMQKVTYLKHGNNNQVLLQLQAIDNNMSLTQHQKLAAVVAIYDEMFPTYVNLTHTLIGSAVVAVTAGMCLVYNYVNKANKEVTEQN